MRKLFKPVPLLAAALALGVGGPTFALASSEPDGATHNDDLATQVDNANSDEGQVDDQGAQEPNANNHDLADQVENENENGDDQNEADDDAPTGATGASGPTGPTGEFGDHGDNHGDHEGEQGPSGPTGPSGPSGGGDHSGD
jgi:hypothetical protein